MDVEIVKIGENGKKGENEENCENDWLPFSLKSKPDHCGVNKHQSQTQCSIRYSTAQPIYSSPEPEISGLAG